MKQIARLLIIALAVLLSRQDSRCQVDPALAARLQVIIDSVRSAQALRGVSAAVIIPSSVPNHGMWRGVSYFSHGSVPITPGMKFCIASNTKLFISTLMLKLQEMNILSLDDSLHRWIPSFPNVNPNITIRQLLNHTSGVFDVVEHPGYANSMNADSGRFWVPESIVTNFVNSPYFNPGNGWHYSNTNYTLAGMVITAATDSAVSHNLRHRILYPMDLRNSFFPLEESVPDTIAHGWANFLEYTYPWTSWTSSQRCFGNMYSTAEDLARWYDSLFSGRVLSQASMNQMLTFVPTTETYRYGLGIARVVVNQKIKYQHDGTMQKGYRSGIRIDSTSRYIIAVLNNHGAANPFQYVNALDNAIRAWLDSVTVGVREGEVLPGRFQLEQNYPNPFNPSTVFSFQLLVTGDVLLKIYDVLGREVATVVNETMPPGEYTRTWDATGFASGVYLYRMSTADFTQTRKLLLLR
jgi:CubicO group peptidase (beta-lactamase class C family)